MGGGWGGIPAVYVLLKFKSWKQVHVRPWSAFHIGRRNSQRPHKSSDFFGSGESSTSVGIDRSWSICLYELRLASGASHVWAEPLHPFCRLFLQILQSLVLALRQDCSILLQQSSCSLANPTLMPHQPRPIPVGDPSASAAAGVICAAATMKDRKNPARPPRVRHSCHWLLDLWSFEGRLAQASY